METSRIATDKWYKCPYCLNYSIVPMKCCGMNMITIEEDETQIELQEEN